MKVSFLIIGQGLAGSLLAYKMYKYGLSFKIIASPQITKASDVAAGLFNPLVFKRLTKSWKVDDCLPVMFETYNEIEKLLDNTFLFKKDIIKPLTSQENDLWTNKLKQNNFSYFIDKIHIKKPIEKLSDFHSYGHVKHSGFVNISHMLDELKKFFLKKDLLIEQHFNYEDLKIENTQIKWKNTLANQIVFCEGHSVRSNPFFKDIVQPTKGELLEIFCEDLTNKYIINKQLFIMPLGNNRFKIGATYNWNNIDEKSTIEAKSDLLKRFEQLIKLPYKVLNQYAGIRPTVKDRRPILGRHPNYNQLTIFNGLGTKGVLLAPFFASEMIRYLTIKNYSLSPEIDVKRFYKKY